VNLLWWKKEDKEEVEPEPPKVKMVLRSKITILFTDKSTYTLWTEIDSKKDKLLPYMDFYKWFFCRDSEMFRLEHKSGELVFKRQDVSRVSIDVEEKEEMVFK